MQDILKFYIPWSKRLVFLENLACFVFLLPPFWELPFCFSTDEICFALSKKPLHTPQLLLHKWKKYVALNEFLNKLWMPLWKKIFWKNISITWKMLMLSAVDDNIAYFDILILYELIFLDNHFDKDRVLAFYESLRQAFFISSTFISNARLKWTKKQAKTKQHPEDELLLFEKYSLSLFTLSTKSNGRYSKKCTQNMFVCLNEVMWLMSMKMRLEMKDTSHRYDIYRPKPRHWHKFTEYMFLI